MCGWHCGVVVCARNEEKVIGECLASLREQTAKVFIIVVNDGSSDKTSEVASKYANIIVNLPRHKESWAGKPELARVINAGLDVLKEMKIAYVLISGADTVYPPSYIEEMVGRMKEKNIVLASGVAESEVFRSLSPRGSGRVIDVEWFKSVGFRYPENYGFEGYLVYKALSEGRKAAVFPDLRFKLVRGTRLSRQKMYFWGKGMKALNYWWPYAIGRIIIIGLRKTQNSHEMLKGYLSSTPIYEDVRRFVPRFQITTFCNRIKEVVQGLMRIRRSRL